FDLLSDSGEISGFGQYACNAAPKNSTCNPNNKVATYIVRKGDTIKLPTSKSNSSNMSEECRNIDPNTLKSYYMRKLPQTIISRINLMVSF
ncbi:22613_t:CDS:2, partial [Gigaspora rosea]